MSLNICLLASGSKGNCTYITDGNTSLLIDIGLNYKTLVQRALKSEIDLSSVCAVINTHCHTDHCKGIGTFIKKHDIPLYSHSLGIKHLACKTGINEKRISSFDNEFNVGSLTISPFILSHDAPVCCGFSIEKGKKRISVATDLGKADERTLQNIYRSDIAVLECNHDEQMLKTGRYPYALKRRILSDYGHLSNDDCARAVVRLIEKGTKNFILAHLSEENNLPELAFNCLSDYLNLRDIKEGVNYNVVVASQHRATKLICV